jgi:hypothetical protein
VIAFACCCASAAVTTPLVELLMDEVEPGGVPAVPLVDALLLLEGLTPRMTHMDRSDGA